MLKTYLELYVIDGGPMMAPLLLCTVLLVAFIIHSMIRLRRGRLMPGHVGERVRRVTDPKDRIALANEVRHEKSPLARALWMTMRELDVRHGTRPPSRQLDPIVNEACATVSDDLYEGISIFAAIYTIAPLLGLMGTILGMMNAFREFAQLEQKSLESISRGIQEALITTLWGLGIAIVAFVLGHVFHGNIRSIERDRMPARLKEMVAVMFTKSPPVKGSPGEASRSQSITPPPPDTTAADAPPQPDAAMQPPPLPPSAATPETVGEAS